MKHFDQRWRLSRAGVVNVWHYYETEFQIGGGRLILRGANGSGKSRALEMLLPYLLDADRRRMDATGSNKVSLDELMRTGAREQTNRAGYLWIELVRGSEYLTLGAHVKYSASAHRSDVQFFNTPLRVGHDLRLIEGNRTPLTRDALGDLVGAHNLTDAEGHREAVRNKVFGLRGESGRDRYSGLIQLMHTLRSPDVGNRIDEGNLPQLISNALPPLSEQTLQDAGERLDNLTETRLAQERLASTLEQVRTFHSAYRSYAATVLTASAKNAISAADAVVQSDRRREELRVSLQELMRQRDEKQTRQKSLQDESAELDAAITALKEHELFKQADDLKQRDDAVAALRSLAETTLASAQSARRGEADAANRMHERYDELREAVRSAGDTLISASAALAGSGVAHPDLPAAIYYSDSIGVIEHAIVMTTLDGEPQTIRRPTAARAALQPSDLEPVQTVSERYEAEVQQRRNQAERREQEARRLDKAFESVRNLEAAAESATALAEQDRESAEASVVQRDDTAIALNQSWRQWISCSDTQELMPAASWEQDATMRVLLADIEALSGDDPTIVDYLDLLNLLPSRTAKPFFDAHTVGINNLDAEDANDQSEHAALTAERDDLDAARDPAPPTAPWHSVQRGIPFWQTVDFLPEVPLGDRAALESALLASSILTATVQADGSVHTEDGEVLLRPGRIEVSRPLTHVLKRDPASEVPAEIVDAVLRSIGYADPDAVTSIDTDGNWRNGALSGRYVIAEARHIGAAARAAARAARREQISHRLEELAERARQRAASREMIDAAIQQLADHLATAPRSAALIEARATAATLVDRAAASEASARRAADTATQERNTWAAEFERHKEFCGSLDLPITATELRTTIAHCRSASDGCRRLVTDCRAATGAVKKASRAARDFDDLTDARKAAESDAEAHRSTWLEAAARLAAQHAVLDVPLGELTEELGRTESAQRDASRELINVTKALDELRTEIGGVEKRDAVEESTATALRDTLTDHANRFNAQLALPGLAQAATTTPIDRFAIVGDAESVSANARSALSSIGVSKSLSVTQLQHALQRFQADTSGQLDVIAEFEHDAYSIRIEGAEDRHEPTAVLTYLERRVDEGRQALSARERDVFTAFVLGGVADELRRRINQASNLVQAMNRSLSSIETSHGIGVRIGWLLNKEQTELARVMHLVSIADAVRSAEDNDELITLLRMRVEGRHALDPTAGYASHLAEALDYRMWHDVEVTIVGPAPNQQRRISRRAKISQGETRFVSYVTLFAAADGYLSSLPEPDGALRLVLLDDAFAKIDDRTIGELLGLLVRFDIDFVMTGHALWGTVPEVPELDIYEIRRMGDSAAIATRVHWDGKRRHIHAVSAP
ncbi:TIGR02680 family protein [Mycobacterium sp. CVI_P3]|uniref:TIGR02680 family protein n=1 Tax=Mycobacterium pinniadriaticum TaxID=2994102 RepID=A0ABT3SQS6_9MYCO|nr:TIGR02680 family protein [Mycobacterium pinniadriaticum]MCX2934808.1 TIGR02680 family protein [Mycobacterium pinniadriaticum]MCX2941230.1 TIGR02680 family protein [Mycobacterium pinniadriaticum]